jgi:hypothetical protein
VDRNVQHFLAGVAFRYRPKPTVEFPPARHRCERIRYGVV